jgi:predicted DNA-binding protein
MTEAVEEGFDVFLHDGDKAVGAVREVHPKSITIYIENAGDFVVSRDAIRDVHDEKVVLDSAKLDKKLKDAIAQEHSREDPTI